MPLHASPTLVIPVSPQAKTGTPSAIPPGLFEAAPPRELQRAQPGAPVFGYCQNRGDTR